MLSLYAWPHIRTLPDALAYAQSVFPVGQFFTLAVFFIALIAMSFRTDVLKAFAAASFAATIVAIFLFSLSMVQDYFVYAGVVCTMGSMIILYFRPEYA